MLTKKELKDIQNLSLAANRKDRGLFVVEGSKMVNELLQLAPDRIEAVYARREWSPKNTFEKLIEITETELSKISQLSTPNHVLATVQMLPPTLPSSDSFVLYLDTIQDPGNMGTIIRTADWFGINHIVCSRGCADVYSSKVVQATMSSIIRVNVFMDNEETWLRNQRRPVLAAALDGEPILNQSETSNAVLVIGNESKGIRQEFLNLATRKITIPRIGEAESLNAAVATGILLSELTKYSSQRK